MNFALHKRCVKVKPLRMRYGRCAEVLGGGGSGGYASLKVLRYASGGRRACEASQISIALTLCMSCVTAGL